MQLAAQRRKHSNVDHYVCHKPIRNWHRRPAMVVELCLLGRELVHRSRQEAELVPLWVGENHPRHVRSLAHVDPTSAESEQSVELVSRGAAVGPQVDVEPVLASFGLGYRQEVDAVSHVVGPTDREVGLILVDDAPAKDVAPEQRQRFGVDGVDTQDSKMTGHPSILADPRQPLEAADHLKAQRSREARWSMVTALGNRISCGKPVAAVLVRLDDLGMSADTVHFYDGLAADYHLVYGDRWDEAVLRQGASLARVIRDARPDAVTVLDCSCGIGTQTIGLALEGFRVTGTDVSPGSVARARVEARRWGVDVEFGVADFRDLRAIDGPFDLVLSADNALPHLLDDVDVLSALTAMRTRMGDGGLLIVTMRDYDQALLDRPATAVPLVVAGPPRRVVVRLHDWDGPQSAFYTVRLLICTEHDDGQWTTEHHRARYRAMTRVAFTSLVGRVEFDEAIWRSGEDVGYHQPVITATAT